MDEANEQTRYALTCLTFAVFFFLITFAVFYYMVSILLFGDSNTIVGFYPQLAALSFVGIRFYLSHVALATHLHRCLPPSSNSPSSNADRQSAKKRDISLPRGERCFSLQDTPGHLENPQHCLLDLPLYYTRPLDPPWRHRALHG